MIDKLKRRLGKEDDGEDELLEDLLEESVSLFLSLRYPVSACPVDEEGKPVVESRYNSWILRCAVQMYSKLGIEGQISSTENSITGTCDSGTVSRSLMREITPVAGIVRGGTNESA